MDCKEYKEFEYNWDLMPEDFKVTVYQYPQTGMRTLPISGVEIELLPYKISVKSHSLKSQIKNKNQCLEMLKAILRNYTLE